MTARTADPDTVLADAGRELLAALADLLDEHPDRTVEPDAVAGLLDQVSTVLRRARGRVRRAEKAAAPARPVVVEVVRPARVRVVVPAPRSPLAAFRTPEPPPSARPLLSRPGPPIARPPVDTAVKAMPASVRTRAARQLPRLHLRRWLRAVAVVMVVALLALLVPAQPGNTNGAPRSVREHRTRGEKPGRAWRLSQPLGGRDPWKTYGTEGT